MPADKNIILYSHGGSANHGCEALVRSTCSILSDKLDNPRLNLISGAVKEDERYMGEICNYRSLIRGRRDIDFLRAFLNLKLFGRAVYLDILPYKSIVKSLEKDTLALSIGGDNYCYGDTAYYAALNKMFRKSGHKTVLWGCSINREVMNGKSAVDDLRNYSLITARESLTYDALTSAGLTNVKLFPDPAFTLAIDRSAIPNYFKEFQTVGINVSTMIQDNEQVSGCTIESYKTLIKNIINDTHYEIALIPHVVWKQSDDRVPLQLLFDEFKDCGRIRMIEDANAEQLKGVISKCRFMVAARTHASIAAYSTCVPTLVVGYSVKAKGIAKDIFGSYEDYVLPVQELRSPDDLSEKFRWIMDNENEIRTHLQEFMPGYIAKAWEAGEALKQI